MDNKEFPRAKNSKKARRKNMQMKKTKKQARISTGHKLYVKTKSKNTGIIQGKTKGGIIGSKGYGSTNIINCYYLSNVNQGVGNDSSISVINKDEKYLKSQEFVVLLNQYIDDNRR